MQLGLMPDGKQAAIVPFNDRENGKQATLIPMIKGQLMLARRAVPGIVLQAKTVYREDEFEHEEGTEPFIRHIPNANGSRTDGDIVAVYARAKFPNAKEWEFEVLYRADHWTVTGRTAGPGRRGHGSSSTANRRRRPS